MRTVLPLDMYTLSQMKYLLSLTVLRRIIADGGTMVEIGKKDILNRNVLSMEPFNRNASFRALDLSHDQISDDIVAKYYCCQTVPYLYELTLLQSPIYHL